MMIDAVSALSRKQRAWLLEGSVSFPLYFSFTQWAFSITTTSP